MEEPKRPTRRAEGLITSGTCYEPDACPFVFAAGVWHSRRRYWPIITCWRKETMDDAFCAILSAGQEEAIDAADIAESSVEQLLDAWDPLPQTTADLRKLVSESGYRIRAGLDPEDIISVDAIRHQYGEDEDEILSIFSAELDIDEPPSWPSRPFLIACIWRSGKRYWPVLTFAPEDPAQAAICAVKSESRRRPTRAALISLIDLKQTQLIVEPIRTETQARQFMETMSYTVRPDLDLSDVTPAEDVREPDEYGMSLFALALNQDVEEYIRIGTPRIFKETSERLIGMGLSDDEALGLMCKALVEDYALSRGDEITPESLAEIVEVLSRLPDLRDN